MSEFVLHINNHKNRKSYDKMTSGEKKKSGPSYTIVGILEDDTFRFGVSICSMEDSFSKEIGRKRALRNALDAPLNPIPSFILKNGGLGSYFAIKAKRLIK